MARAKKRPVKARQRTSDNRLSAKSQTDANDSALRNHLVNLLNADTAHLDFDRVIRGWPEALRGVKPEGAPHTPWQLLEHLRIAQRDILEFSRNPKYTELEFPTGYWPPAEAPPTPTAWEQSAREFRADREKLQQLVAASKTDLFARIPHGTGQTMLREALLAADHNAYHIGQLVLLRRLLGAWAE